VSHAYPLDTIRKIDRDWQRRFPSPRPLTPLNVDDSGGGHCPACNAPASIAPAAADAEYRGAELIHHHWLCRCGHAWISVLHAPA